MSRSDFVGKRVSRTKEDLAPDRSKALLARKLLIISIAGAAWVKNLASTGAFKFDSGIAITFTDLAIFRDSSAEPG
jgi:hypothetical protein